MSGFMWLDYSEQDRRKMLDVVDLFREHDTRDELGIGSVRDAFADQLFPGTSTIMTRARYFLLIPWTYRALEHRGISADRIVRKARIAETSLIQAIEQSEDSNGNIGKQAGGALKRLPSSVYWAGLGVWGIRRFHGSLARYNQAFDHFRTERRRHAGRDEERNAEHDDHLTVNWHSGLPDPPEGFPDECSLKVTRAEGEYLSRQLLEHPGCAGSLLAELAGGRVRCSEVEFAWEHPSVAGLPEKIRTLLNHAQNFSEAMHGAALIYNLILAEQVRMGEKVEDYRSRLKNWAGRMESRASEFNSWKREDFWTRATQGNPRIAVLAVQFATAWLEHALAGRPGDLADSPVVRDLIRNRERRLKKSLARIDNPRAQESWSGASGTAQLDYRWKISRVLLTDIFDGLEERDA